MLKNLKEHLFTHPRRGLWDSVPMAFAWRYICHSIMVFMSIIGEGIPAPTLHDRIISMVPIIPLIAKYNYHIWLFCYVPIAAWFWMRNRNRFVEFLFAGGIVSLLRGFCIFLTNLGPVNGRDINAGKSFSELVQGWIQIINPFSALTTDAVHMYLTKDLFFSGHTASTFLLLLYTWKYKSMRIVALVGHVIVVSTVFLSHLHYSIDVVGGWAVSFVVFIAAEKFFQRYRSTPPTANPTSA
ncbi:MAG: phosphatase PAP2 family protein [Deltaproteobacteria bacterium]|nr:phosphatase PAP2 family protein [Deltaproteobacteria bacterium]MBN2672000.1 phosphatase PAP2 family protein [Deltaproteobacteria bacterium]